MNVSGKVLNDSNNDIKMSKAVSTISGAISSSFRGKVDKIEFETNVQLEIANNMNDIKESDHLFVLTDKISTLESGSISGATNMIGGMVAFIDSDYFVGVYDVLVGKFGEGGRTSAHEFGHMTGLKHSSNFSNLMRQGGLFHNITDRQLIQIHNERNMNLGKNYEMNMLGQKRPNRGNAHIFIRQQ